MVNHLRRYQKKQKSPFFLRIGSITLKFCSRFTSTPAKYCPNISKNQRYYNENISSKTFQPFDNPPKKIIFCREYRVFSNFLYQKGVLRFGKVKRREVNGIMEEWNDGLNPNIPNFQHSIILGCFSPLVLPIPFLE